MSAELLLFGGTTEGRELARALRGHGFEITLCVATEYGRDVIPDASLRARTHVGRMDAKQMAAFMAERRYGCAVDATHPYAVEATENIRRAAAESGLPYYRLRREAGDDAGVHVRSAREAAELLAKASGNILLTTGSKDLAAFTLIPNYGERVYVRVLPSIPSLEQCLSLGYATGRIIAMQGPFSQALNEALLREFAVAHMVTKNSGAAGGYAEKVEAAQACGARLITIGKPEREEGMDLAALLDALCRRFGA